MDSLSSLVVELARALWDPFKRHAAYLLCAGRHVEQLQERLEVLEQRRREVQLDVDAALRCGRVLREDAQRWLASVDAVASEAKALADQLTLANCSAAGTCTVPCLRYGVSREAVAKLTAVDELQLRGSFPEGVSRAPPPPRVESLPPNVGFEAFASTKLAMERVLEAVQDPRVRIVGVYGMGGVGKTTLMKEVAKSAARGELFDEVVMVTVSRNPDTKKIQREMGDLLGLKFDEDSEAVRAARLAGRLEKTSRPLLILDDIWERLELVNIGIYLEGEKKHPGCKVVITTRNRDVCSDMEAQTKVKVESLPMEEAWTLFRARAGEVVDSPSVRHLARGVARECQGLPLALVTLGRAMKDKQDPRAWTTVLEQLQRSMPANIPGMQKQVFQSIRLSFDSLEGEETKLFFLFCCLFPEDYEIEVAYLTRYFVGEGLLSHTDTLEAAERHVLFMFENIKASGLLLESSKPAFVKMHDVVRDVAVWIAKQEASGFHSRAGQKFTGLEEFRRISLMYNNLTDLPDKPLGQNLRTLLLSGNWRLKALYPQFFVTMDALMVLDMRGTGIRCLPSSLPCLVNLTTLCLDDCWELEDLSWIANLKKVEILSLRYLRKLGVLPRELGGLTNLRCLDLTGNCCRIPPGIISQLSMLEQLYLAEGFDKWKPQDSRDTNHAAFAELLCLSCLTDLFVDIDDGMCLSENLGRGSWEMLRRFKIGPSRLIESIFFRRRPMILPKKLMTSPNNLTFMGRMADWALPLLPTVEELAFFNPEKMRMMEIPSLKSNWEEDLPQGSLQNLKSLFIDGCHNLKYLFSPELTSSLRELVQLQIENCRQMDTIFTSNMATGMAVVLFPKLETLDLKGLPSLESIWVGDLPQGSLRNLKQLTISNCHNLKYLFSLEVALLLSNLVLLEIRNCRQMLTIFSSNMAHLACKLLPKLELLELEFLPSLTRILHEDVPQGSLGCLKELTVSQCFTLRYILSPALALTLVELQVLRISRCHQMERIFQSIMVGQVNFLPKLSSLSVKECGKLASLLSWREIHNLQHLERLEISHCYNLKAVIMSEEETVEDKKSVFPKLTRLELINLSELSSFNKENFVPFDWPCLKIVRVRGCSQLKKLPLGPQSAPMLIGIEATEEWFESLEWEDESIYMRLRPLLEQSGEIRTEVFVQSSL